MAHFSVLVIEDTLDSRRLFTAYLSTIDAELEVNVVPSAEEAFLITARGPVDLLITDYMLPGMTGGDMVRRLRRRYPDLKAILVTALDEQYVRKEVEELGIRHFLRKPIDMNDFVNAVQECLGIGAAQPDKPLATQQKPMDTTSKLQLFLRELQQNLYAYSAMLLDNTGYIEAKSGDAPDLSFEAVWLPAIKALLAQMINTRSQVKTLYESAILLRGEKFDIVITPVADHALVLLTRPTRGKSRLWMALGQAMEVYPSLMLLLGKTPPQPQNRLY